MSKPNSNPSKSDYLYKFILPAEHRSSAIDENNLWFNISAASHSCASLPLFQVPFYWMAQFVSATAGAALIRGILGSEKALGATVPAGDEWESLLLEIVLTFFLMFVIAAVATDTRAVGMMAGIAVRLVSFRSPSSNLNKELPQTFEGMAR